MDDADAIADQTRAEQNALRAHPLEYLSQRASTLASSTWGTLFALGVLACWGVAGLAFGWESAWYYTEGLMTTTTFVLLFLLQRAQSKDSLAIQIKLNELLAAVRKASPKLINIEDMAEGEIRKLHQEYQHLQSKGHGEHSIEEHQQGGEAAGQRDGEKPSGEAPRRKKRKRRRR